MKRMLLIALGLTFSAGVMAGADHYIRRDGNHVQHLKVTRQNDEVRVLVDVDFDAGNNREKSCSVEISGEAKVLSENELVLKKQASGEAHYCQLKIHLNGDEAAIEESADCSKYFAGGTCRFDSEGKVLTRVK